MEKRNNPLGEGNILCPYIRIGIDNTNVQAYTH